MVCLNVTNILILMALISMFAQISMSSEEKITNEKNENQITMNENEDKITEDGITQRLLIDSNEIQVNTKDIQFTDVPKDVIGYDIWFFLDVEDKKNICLLSKWFKTMYGKYLTKPFIPLHAKLNILDRELNSKFTEEATLCYVKNADIGWPEYTSNTINPSAVEYALNKNKWESYVNLQKYGDRNFELKFAGNEIEFEVRQNYVSNETVTNPKVGDWIGITKYMKLDLLIDFENMSTEEVSITGLDNWTEIIKYMKLDLLIDFENISTEEVSITGLDNWAEILLVRQVIKNESNETIRIIASIIEESSEEQNNFKLGKENIKDSYLIPREIFNEIHQILPISKQVKIRKGNEDQIEVHTTDLSRLASNSLLWTNSNGIEGNEKEPIRIMFYPRENKVVILKNNEECITLLNPNFMSITANVFEYGVYFKTILE